jgi:DNA-binding NarL/FixJ family response regulator
MSDISPIAVIVVDDDREVLDAIDLRLRRDPEITVAALYQSAEECLAGVVHLHPDVAIVDMRLQRGANDGVELIRQLRTRFPKIRCIVYTATDYRSQYLAEAVNAGAVGYLIKGKRNLAEIIKSIAHGEVIIDEALVPRLKEIIEEDIGASTEPHLDNRDRDILRLLKQGQSADEIAQTLVMQVGTVRWYLQRLRDKFRVHSNDSLRLIAYLRDNAA